MQAKLGRSGRPAPIQPALRRSTAQPLRRALLALALVSTLALLGAPAQSAMALSGDWSGEGTVTQVQGPTEKVQCRVRYKQESEKVFGVIAKCASTSKKMSQTGKLLKINADVYVGEFHNQQYDIAGRVRVVVDGATQTVTFKSARGQGTVMLTRH